MGTKWVQEWKVALVNVTELLEAVARAKCRPLILSPELFQYHTASRPTCVQGPVFPSVTTVVIPGHGDKPLFPSQVPLSLPLPRPAHCFPVVFSCLQSLSILVTGLSAF